MRRRPPRSQWAATALAVAALAGCSGNDGSTDSGPTKPLQGTFTIAYAAGNADPCAPAPGHPDLVDGAPVVVLDGAGTVIAEGSLGDGSPVADTCVRTFRVDDVPDVAGFRVTVGSYGPIDVTAEALAAAGGALDLRLGL